MSLVFTLIALFGGLAMFLYGMETMGNGLKNASGSTLKRVLEKVTSNVFTGVLMGTLVTAIIQSSTATIVITVGLITAGILNLKQAVSIVFGANIGTTITAQIIRLMDIDTSGDSILNFFKPSTLAPIAICVGIIFIMFVKKNNSRAIGEIFAGFGILFTGIMTMSSAVEPLTQSPAFIEVINKFATLPVLGILTGFVCTVIAQSSSAMVGMLQAISSTGVMTFDVVYPIIMGINIGTCVTTAIVCSIGTSKDAKRTGVAHIVFNIAGTAIFMMGMTVVKRFDLLPDLWGKLVDSGDIANFQTLFNLATAILLIPLAGIIVKLTYLLIKPDKEREKDDYSALHTLSDKLFEIPSMAIAEASVAIGAMGRVAHENFKTSISLLGAYNEGESKKIDERELELDQFTDNVENFLVRLSRNTLSEEQSETLNSLIQASSDFERIGDYATNINEFAERMYKEKLTFSPSAIEELNILLGAVSEIIEMAVTSYVNGDEALAKKIEPLEEVIDDMVQYLSDSHINRLKKGDCTVTSGIIFIETLTYLERASDQCSSIAMLLLSMKNPKIRKNHHEYIHELHKGLDDEYERELKVRQAQYLAPLTSQIQQ